jgi:ketosteroid isomerase-like protein
MKIRKYFWVRAVAVVVLAGFVAAVGRPLVSAPNHSSSAPGPELQRELLTVRESVWHSWFDNDQKALSELLPGDLIAINNAQADWDDFDKTLASARRFAGEHGRLISLRFPKTKMQVYGDIAVLYSEFEMQFTADGGAKRQSGRATEIFLRQNGRWINTGWHLDSGK